QLLEREPTERLLRSLAELVPMDLRVVDGHDDVVAEFVAGPSAGRPDATDIFSVEYASRTVRVPIAIHGEVVGHAIGCPRSDLPPARATATCRLLAQVLADQAYKEHELHSLSMELIDKYEEITLLYDVSQALGSVFDIPTICEIALDKARQAVAAERVFVMLREDESEHLTVVATPEGGVLGRRIAMGAGVSGRAAASGKPILLNHGQLAEIGLCQEQAVLSVPMLYTTDQGLQEVVGVITLAGKPPGEMFTAGDLKLMTSIATQTAIAIHSSRMIEALREAERVRQELEIAARIQQNLLPQQPPRVPGVELVGRCVPAANVGGDYYDLVVDRRGHLTLLIADVSGHSVGAALMMAMARSVLHREIAEGKSPATILAHTNAAMFNDLSNASLFITAFCARYEPETRRLTFANGGHNPPLLWRSGEGRMMDLDSDGLIIGVLDDVEYEEKSVTLKPGDVVLLFTDGIIEARNTQGEFFGEERLQRLLREYATDAPNLLMEYILQAVHQHIQDIPQQDDITLLVLSAQEAT
ncbi:MAG: GAF domain-containing protein, partial [Caldilineae bacterium]